MFFSERFVEFNRSWNFPHKQWFYSNICFHGDNNINFQHCFMWCTWQIENVTMILQSYTKLKENPVAGGCKNLVNKQHSTWCAKKYNIYLSVIEFTEFHGNVVECFLLSCYGLKKKPVKILFYLKKTEKKCHVGVRSDKSVYIVNNNQVIIS